MEEQLVSFQTAVLAKEGGFNIEQGNYYNSHGQLNESLEDFFIPRFEAPSQSLLQRWLREVHRIHIEIRWWSDDTYSAQLISDNYDWGDLEEYEAWECPSYEDALEIVLQKALELIK